MCDSCPSAPRASFSYATWPVLHYHEYCTPVTDCLKLQLQWTDLQMIKDAILVLATHGWQKTVDEEETSQSEGTDGKDLMKPFQRLGKSLEAPLNDLHSLPT